MKFVDDPDERFWYPPAACRGCGTCLDDEPVLAERRHQVTDIDPAPSPKISEHVAQAKECPCCGTVTEGELPAHVRARASFGPETHAQAANLVTGHHIPVWRSMLLLCQLAGIAVSTGWMAGVRGKAAALIAASGFMSRVRELLKAAPAVHADETPARAAGGIRYVHPAPTWTSSPTTKQKGPSARSRCNSAAQEAAGALCKDSPTSPSSSPTCPPPPNGASANPAPFAASSTGTPGCPYNRPQ
jgi:transposase